jgi:hypothetical protein
VESLTTPNRRAGVRGYCQRAAAQSDQDRTAEGREKTGVWTGSYGINPVNGEALPDLVGGLRADGLRHRRQQYVTERRSTRKQLRIA